MRRPAAAQLSDHGPKFNRAWPAFQRSAPGPRHRTEANIHAGAKYMNRLTTRCIKGVDFSPADLALFVLAFDNAGAAIIARMRAWSGPRPAAT
jgi:hypothetical protein